MMSELGDNKSNDTSEVAFKVPQLKPLVIKKVGNKPEESIEKVSSSNNDDSEEGKSDQQHEKISPDVNDVKEESVIVKKSPAEILKDQDVPLPYKEPSWSNLCEDDYSFEVLKEGVINSTVKLCGKSFIVFGRLPSCDNILHHPSISRYHAVVQYRKNVPDDEKGDGRPACFLYDLGSTHGTFLNKVQIKPKVYYRIRVGHMIKFGKSTRMYILQGPEHDQEEESKETVTELIEMRKKQEDKLDGLNEDDEEPNTDPNGTTNKPSIDSSDKDTGINWGMGEDADEETDLSVNPYALSAPNEELYLDDPKKTLRGFFEREGCELEYKVEEKGYSTFVCRIELPLDSPTGHPIIAEASVKGKKKEAVVQCALEACRILDRHGTLRQSKHESRKRKQKNWENDDYYDSDDDTFLDRTGVIEKKREKRMVKANKAVVKAETYDSLKEKFDDIAKKIETIEESILKSQTSDDSNLVEDSLEAYMSSVKAGIVLDKKAVTSMKIQVSQLKQEKIRLEKLINIAKPAHMPELKKLDGDLNVKNETKKKLPLTGSMKGKNKRFKYLTAPKILPSSLERPKATQLDEQGHQDDLTKTLLPPPPTLLEMDSRLQSSEVEDKSSKKEEISVPPGEDRLLASSKAEAEEENKIKNESLKSQFEEIERKELKRKQKLLKKKEKMNYEYDSKNPNYAMWVPPDDQAGDGKTHLNEKFGY